MSALFILALISARRLSGAPRTVCKVLSSRGLMTLSLMSLAVSKMSQFLNLALMRSIFGGRHGAESPGV